MKEQIELPIEFRDKRNSDWYWISRLVYEEYASKIGVIGLALYNAYASYARDKAEAWPSLKTISKKLKISIPTIVRYNELLEKYKLIEIKSGKQNGKPNMVYLLKVKGIKQVNTPSKAGLDPGIKQVNTNDKNTNDKNRMIVIAEQSSAGKEINDLIELFKPINPTYERLFSNNTQRDALGRLIKKFGREKVEEMIKSLPRIFGKPYAPRISTPYLLEQKLADLISYFQQEKSKGPKVVKIR